MRTFSLVPVSLCGVAALVGIASCGDAEGGTATNPHGSAGQSGGAGGQAGGAGQAGSAGLAGGAGQSGAAGQAGTAGQGGVAGQGGAAGGAGTAGQAGAPACSAGYSDCDSSAANGCEIHSDVDPKNCGACANVCPSGACEGGLCTKILYAPYVMKNWGSSVSGTTQWSAPYVGNPNAAAASVTVTVHRVDSDAVLHTFNKSIPAYAQWSGYADTDWQAIPNTSATGALGWVEVRSTSDLVATNWIDFRQGGVYNGPLTRRDVEPFTAKLSAENATWAFLKNWPSPSAGDTTHTQWTTIAVVNPLETAATATVRVYDRSTGNLITSFNKTIQPRQWWNAYGDSDWGNAGAASDFAWVSVASTAPLFGVDRWTFREGSASNSPVTLFDDANMAGEPLKDQFATLYVKRWSSGSGRTQWSYLAINNPNDSAASITVTVHSTDGSGLLAQFTKSIPAHAMWWSVGDPMWTGITESDTTNHRSLGWIEVTSDVAVVGSNVIDIVSGTNDTDQLFIRDINRMTKSATTSYASVYLRNWATEGTDTQFSSLVVTNANNAPVTLTVTVHRVDTGAVLSTFTKTIPAGAWWNSYADTDWDGVPDTMAGASIGWVTLSATAPVSGTLRYRRADSTGSLVVVDDHPLLIVGD